MPNSEHIIAVLDQVSKLLDERIGNRPQAKILVDNLMEAINRDAQRSQQDFKMQELNSQSYPADRQDEILKINEIIRFVNFHTVRR